MVKPAQLPKFKFSSDSKCFEKFEISQFWTFLSINYSRPIYTCIFCPTSLDLKQVCRIYFLQTTKNLPKTSKNFQRQENSNIQIASQIDNCQIFKFCYYTSVWMPNLKLQYLNELKVMCMPLRINFCECGLNSWICFTDTTDNVMNKVRTHIEKVVENHFQMILDIDNDFKSQILALFLALFGQNLSNFESVFQTLPTMLWTKFERILKKWSKV